jgi:hypothetical protein|nr:MAG TPA: hypothetical protein [Caudoviricetes sp.]
MNFKKIALDATIMSELMNGRDKMDTEELIEKYPNGVTIDFIDNVNMQQEDGEENVWIFVTEEQPNKFTFAGFVLAKIFNNILAEFESDYAEMIETYNSALKEDKLRVKLERAKTKSKREITKVTVL